MCEEKGGSGEGKRTRTLDGRGDADGSGAGEENDDGGELHFSGVEMRSFVLWDVFLILRGI